MTENMSNVAFVLCLQFDQNNMFNGQVFYFVNMVRDNQVTLLTAACVPY